MGIKRILWAVDPFAEDEDLQRSAAWAIKAMANDSATVEPVYLWNSHMIDDPLELPYELLREIRRSARENFARILKGVHLKGIRPLRVLPCPHFHIRDGVDRITELAKRWKADLVVSSTRARKGPKYWTLGSFAETLLLYSDVPLFLVNPTWKPVRTFKHIIFPTDFSEESKRAFYQVLDFSKSLKCKITIFNKVEYAWMPYYKNYQVRPAYERFLAQDMKNRRTEAAEWVNAAKDAGVSATSLIDSKHSGSMADIILEQAKKMPGIIAMASHSGPVKSALLGSVARKIVRASPYPVWVLHPQLKERTKKRPLIWGDESDISLHLRHFPRQKKIA